jgi:hypothetical protein
MVSLDKGFNEFHVDLDGWPRVVWFYESVSLVAQSIGFGSKHSVKDEEPLSNCEI